MAKISICLPVLNGADYVQDALRSIQQQNCTDYHVLASDNGSDDGTAEVLKHWADKVPMRILTQPKTLPMQDHFNLLLDSVQTEFLMTLCHDDFFADPDAIGSALQIAEENHDVSAIYCDLAYVNRNRRTLARRRFGREGRFDAETVGRASLKTARNMFGIPLLLRRSSLGTIRYDPKFHYLMDLDLAWTLSKNSAPWHIPKIMIANRFRGSNATWSLLSSAHTEYMDLAEKHNVELSNACRRQIRWMNWKIGRKKQIFGIYERLMTAIG